MMLRFILGAMLPCLALGCVEMQVKLREPSTPPVPATTIATPVTADQVTSANARRMAEALWDEFDREESALAKTPVER